MNRSDALPSGQGFDSVQSDKTRGLARVDNVSTLVLWMSMAGAIVAVFLSVKLLTAAIAAFVVAAVVKKWNYSRLKASFVSDALAAGMSVRAAEQCWFETMEE